MDYFELLVVLAVVALAALPSVGVIVCVGDDRATFHTSFSLWPDHALAFDRSTSQVSSVGRRFWPNGALSWISITKSGQKHYFSSETGTWVFGSKRTTEELYEKINEHLGNKLS